MRSIFALALFLIAFLSSTGQVSNPYKSGLTAEQNLIAIGKLNPNAQGGIGFDERYEGVKGSRMLFDTLLPALIKVKGQEYYLQLDADIEAESNLLKYKNPSNGRFYTLGPDMIMEIVFRYKEQDLAFKTSVGLPFEKPLHDQKFCQVLFTGKADFLKIAYKVLLKADYKGAYTSDTRYDEYKTDYKYYLKGPDSLFHQINLTKKSLSKLYPDKKEFINKSPDPPEALKKEDIFLNLIKEF
jgi:hypothetical protein